MAFYSLPCPYDYYQRWDVYCVVCGGPSLNPSMIVKDDDYHDPSTPAPDTVSIIAHLPLLTELGSRLEWLDRCVGVPANNVPMQLGLYDCTGDFMLSDDKLFGPYPSYAQAPRTNKKQYGLNCHAACYQLLHDRLGYKLRYQDIWPKLAAANDDSECLNSTYGGMTDYHEHRFEYSSMNEDKTGWMLLDPTENEQNAQRILTVWRNVPEARRPPLVLAVLCTFRKAAQLAEAKHAADDNHLLWQTMAKVPSSMLRTILERAYFHPDYLESTPQTQHAEGM